MSAGSYVVITKAPDNDYLKNYVTLPKNYGTDEYYSREDVLAIRTTVFQNLTDLDKHTGFTKAMRGKKVIVKPNLVSVYHKIGFKDPDYPQSTDPRVLDSIIEFVQQYTDNIVIAESSGRGMPTRASFAVSGIDRLAKHRNARILPLEEQPLDRYILPKAQVMKDIRIPKIFSEVVRGEAFYISVPKLKTNLYTGVTLGFKNAMGTIPYNLRQKNHNYMINKKLVDMLFLFKPDLVVIDGIVGGEGNTPAPIDPVPSRVIISGNNSVEADRVATRMMGFDPDEIPLMVEARNMGFGCDNVEIIGTEKVIPFRRPDVSLHSARFRKQFPNVKFLVGHMKNNAPGISDVSSVTPDVVREITGACIGGCLPCLRQAFEFVYYEGVQCDFQMVVLIGTGVRVNGEVYYFDETGKPYTTQDIKEMSIKKLGMGSCTSHLKDVVDLHIDGCMPRPNEPHMAIHKLIGKGCAIQSLKNKQLGKLLYGMIKTRHERIRRIKNGEWVDCIPDFYDDSITDIPALSDEDARRDFIPWPMPEMKGEIRRIILNDVKKHSF